VPEPNTWTLIAIGAAGIFLFRSIRLRARAGFSPLGTNS
jgi:hypothetical protein